MKGGALFYDKPDIMPELKRFANGTIKFLKRGTYGVLLKLITKQPTLLKKLTKKTIQPCDSILVKIVAINETAYLEKSPMEFVSLEQFETEVHIHQEVVQQSIDIFECSITPALLYAEVYTHAELMKQFIDIGEYVTTKGKIGLIFMENIVDDHRTDTYTLGDYERIDLSFVYSMFPYTRRMLIMLGQLGILHNDYHLDNFLYSDRALYIIDFGLATRMTAEELDEFNGYVTKGDVKHTIQFLFGTLEPHMTSYTRLSLQYQWIRQNQISRYVRGIDTVRIAAEQSIIDPIYLAEEYREYFFIPKKINYVERESESIKESIKQQIRNGTIVLDQIIHDKELMLEFVKVNGKSLQFASPELQEDKEVVLHAVKQNGYALQYTPLDDIDVIMAAVNQTYLAFQLVSPKLRANKEFVKRVLFLDGRCYPDIDDRLKDDPEMMAYARYSEIPFLFRFNPGAQDKIDTFLETHKEKTDTFKIIMKRHRENYPPRPPSLGGKTRKVRSKHK